MYAIRSYYENNELPGIPVVEGKSEKDLFGQGAAAIGALFEQYQQELEAEGETGPARNNFV